MEHVMTPESAQAALKLAQTTQLKRIDDDAVELYLHALSETAMPELAHSIRLHLAAVDDELRRTRDERDALAAEAAKAVLQ